jgi:hypothetical protein
MHNPKHTLEFVDTTGDILKLEQHADECIVLSLQNNEGTIMTFVIDDRTSKSLIGFLKGSL